MSTVLAIGGAGFVGSHMVRRLAAAGHEVVTFDNLSLGHRDAVKHGTLVVGDILDRAAIDAVFEVHRIDLVIHFAALAFPAESASRAAEYWSTNVAGTLNVLAAMVQAGCGRLVFSSTCSVYGDTHGRSVDESANLVPMSVYGTTKLAAEWAIRDFSRAHGLRSVALRYFNAAGADPAGDLAERHVPERRIIPAILRESARVLAGGDPAASTLKVFGTDYPTPDGSCIRDYTHVCDLVRAHELAANHLASAEAGSFEVYNLGSGRGTSVLEVIAAAARVTGVRCQYQVAARRPGDPGVVIADASRATRDLRWAPEQSDVAHLVATAWRASRPYYAARGD